LPTQLTRATVRSARSPERFLDTEAAISERLGRPIEHPIRLFDVDDLGVNFEALRHRVAPSYAQLPWDEYDAKRERVEFLKARFGGDASYLAAFLPDYFAGVRGLDDVALYVDALDEAERRAFDRIRPCRRRAMASFVVHRSPREPLGWAIEREPDSAFTQAKDHDEDFRALARRFAPTPPEVTDAPEFAALTSHIAALADEARGGHVRSLRISCHQMGLVARVDSGVSNTPEGIHQDGADYIVSALVVERRGVEGGESVVYGPDKHTEYLRHTLTEGQGIFQADAGSPLWHWATPVHLSDPAAPEEGVRNILGYDVHVVR
jgi:hypothetical protein